ncbi:MAG: peptide ABC transporter substrate-binding protein [Oscillospiraceae bacterium]|jgi:oligopeptide transport system substrate-binding protein|nr:peptide ABC transporter substrate-binding protein [Oscillospiraceae bacterium]
MKKILAFTLALALLLGAMGTLGAAQATEGGKKLIYAISGDPEQMDPTLNSYSRSATVLKQLFSGLYKAGADGTTMVPALAESYTVSDDGLRYVFTLKPDLKWSDGSPLTAADFEYAWKRVLNPDVASKAMSDLYVLKNGEAYSKGEASVDDVGVKATDGRTLTVDLANNTPWFLTLTSGAVFAPVKKDVVEGATPWTESAATYVSSGPFMLKEYRLKEKLELVKNPYYPDADKVALDAVDIVIIEDASAELVAYDNGEIDVADNLNGEAIAKYKDTPEYEAIARIGIMYHDFNVEKAPFSDKRVRQAFAMSFDRAVITQRVIQTPDVPLYGWVPPRQMSLTDPTKTYREVAGDMFAYDVEKAQALLAEAGYPNGEGFPPAELVVQATQAQKDIAQALQAMWKQNLNVTVNITTYESSAYWTELDNGNFNIDRNGWTADYSDPLANLSIFRTGSNGYENRWDNAEYDAIIDKILAETDPATREALMIEAEKLLADEMPVTPSYSYVDDFLSKPYVQGVTKNALGHVLLEYVTMD